MKERFIEHPNLPEGRVTLAAVGNYPEIINSLNNGGIKTVSFESRTLPEEISRHSDMLLCHTGDNTLFCEPDADASYLKALGFIVNTTESLKNSYPDDVKLNLAVGKDFFICNPKTADSSVQNELIIKGKAPFYVNQGYTKCSVCFITEDAIITEDESVYNALKNSIDVLLISKGDIYLSDKHYGFFGGSSGKISKDTLAITGELKYHKDENRIRAFCEEHQIHIKELKKGRIIDIGSILPLTEMR